MSNINKILKVCSIRWLYKDDEFHIALVDIETNKYIVPCGINANNMKQDINRAYISSSSHMNTLIMSMIIVGTFEESCDIIKWNADMPTVFAFTDLICHVCYIEVADDSKTAKIKDNNSNRTISVTNCAQDCTKALDDLVNYAVFNKEIDYSLSGKNRILFMGDELSIVNDEIIQYDNTSDTLVFGDLNSLYYELFQNMISN